MERILLLYIQRVSLVFQTRTRLITKAFVRTLSTHTQSNVVRE